jgi:photosystem II stability/assembly factor-like uncharacterized protein
MKIIYSISLSVAISIFTVSFLTGCHNDNTGSPEEIHETVVAWAVGSADKNGYATVYKTTDGGETWSRPDANATLLHGFDAENLYVVSASDLWIIGSKQTILHTDNAAKTWQAFTSFPDRNTSLGFYDISAISPSDFWISGDNGMLIHTIDAGKHWTQMDPALFDYGMIQGVQAVDSNTVYIVGTDKNSENGFVYRSIDNGISWESIDILSTSYGWIGVTSKDKNHILVYGRKGHYAKTIDGGDSWHSNQISAGGLNGADINDLVMLNTSTWWNAMDLNNIYFTNDSGTHWVKQKYDAKDNMYLVGIDAVNTRHAIITGVNAGWPQSGKIILTKDEGKTWTLQKKTHSPISKVSFVHSAQSFVP